MQMTEEGLALIRRFEGFRAEAYRCPAGVWTIGYGHTSQAGPPKVRPGMVVSEAEAREILAADAAMFAEGVRAALTREVSPEQFSALVSFAFNVGIGALRRSSVLKAVNEGRFEAVPERLRLWVKADGRRLEGLVRRREAEAELFATQRDLPRTQERGGLIGLLIALIRFFMGRTSW
jgi:lysozyme